MNVNVNPQTNENPTPVVTGGPGFGPTYPPPTGLPMVRPNARDGDAGLAQNPPPLVDSTAAAISPEAAPPMALDFGALANLEQSSYQPENVMLPPPPPSSRPWVTLTEQLGGASRQGRGLVAAMMVLWVLGGVLGMGMAVWALFLRGGVTPPHDTPPANTPTARVTSAPVVPSQVPGPAAPDDRFGYVPRKAFPSSDRDDRDRPPVPPPARGNVDNQPTGELAELLRPEPEPGLLPPPQKFTRQPLGPIEVHNGTWQVTDDRTLAKTQTGLGLVWIKNRAWREATISLGFRLSEGGSGLSLGLAYLTDSPGQLNWKFFTVADGYAYNEHHALTATDTKLTGAQFVARVRNIACPPNTSHQLELLVTDESTRLKIDGQPVMTIANTSDWVGELVVRIPQATAVLDNITVTNRQGEVWSGMIPSLTLVTPANNSDTTPQIVSLTGGLAKRPFAPGDPSATPPANTPPAEPDPIADELRAAHFTYEAALAKIREDLDALLRVREEAARKRGDLSGVETVQGERRLLETPLWTELMPPPLHSRHAAAARQYIAAFEKAIRAYVKAGDDQKARRLGFQLTDFKAALPTTPGGAAANTQNKSRLWQGTLTDGAGEITFTCTDRNASPRVWQRDGATHFDGKRIPTIFHERSREGGYLEIRSVDLQGDAIWTIRIHEGYAERFTFARGIRQGGIAAFKKFATGKWDATGN